MRILLIILICLTLTGCTKPTALMNTNELVENEWIKHNEKSVVCIDGVEYITINIDYEGYMSPHIRADKLNNPKVIKCKGAKNED